jgi:hypothetical protein
VRRLDADREWTIQRSTLGCLDALVPPVSLASSEAAMTATPTTATTMLHTAFFSGFTPRRTELKIQLEIVTAAQIGEAVKGGEVGFDDIQAITEDAQRIAADLDGFGRASAVVTEPAEAAKPVEVKKRIPGNPKERPRSRIR